ncbi:MAG: DUF6788 family protein [Terriglobia bacterium]
MCIITLIWRSPPKVHEPPDSASASSNSSAASPSPPICCPVLTHRRCGQPTCHCATDQKGHPVWSLTFMAEGKKRVERIPQEWVEEVQRLVDAGREFKQAVAEVFAANAQLLALWRRQKGR